MKRFISRIKGLFSSKNRPISGSDENRSTKSVMRSIYRNKSWGGRKHDFYSGAGSHTKNVVEPYIKVVSKFLESFEHKLDVCDLGCGDFNVGRNLVSSAKTYIGIDIVPELIERNLLLFQNNRLKFQCLDIVTEDLPQADCILVRQVLQHLSNKEISQVSAKLKQYKHIIVTEHLPKGEFVPNADKSTGAGIRLSKNSGVVLTAPPFNLNPVSKKELLRVRYKKGDIVTYLYSII